MSSGKSAAVESVANPMIDGFPDSYSNPRGIPRSAFIENIDDYLKTNGPVDPMMKKFQDTYSKYKFMESSINSSRNALRTKIPEMEKDLQALQFLRAQREAGEDIKTHYELADNVYAEAAVDGGDKVVMWLGANVAVEYTQDEAEELLNRNLKVARSNLANNDEDLAFLREQITTMEVNIARVHNWEVKQRQKARAAGVAIEDK